MNKFLCVEKNKRFLLNFGALSSSLFSNYSQHVRFLNIPETLKMPFLSGLAKRPQGILRNQSTRGFFGFESSFQICWNVFSTSGLSQIYEIRNVWKLPSPFSKNTLISYSEKYSWSLKTSFWKKSYPKQTE
jgi:hypothetical protein